MKRAINERPRLAIATTATALVLLIATALITSSLSDANADHGRAMRAQRRPPTQARTLHRLQGELASAQTALAAATQRAKENRQPADADLRRARAWRARAKRAERLNGGG